MDGIELIWKELLDWNPDWDRNSLYNLYNIRESLLDKLKDRGFNNLADIVKVTFEDFSKKTKFKVDTSKRIYLNAKAIIEKKIFLLKPLEFDERYIGYFDIELGGSIEGEAIIFLISFLHADNKKTIQFFAKNNTLEDEKLVLTEFLEYLEKNKIKKLYCYSRKKFDFHWMNDRIKDQGINIRGEYNYGLRLLEEGYDIYWIIKHHVVVPTPNMKLKNLGIAFGFNWRHYGEIDTHNIGSYYHEYSKTKNKRIEKMMFEYNEDDVLVIDHVISKMKAMDVTDLEG